MGKNPGGVNRGMRDVHRGKKSPHPALRADLSPEGEVLGAPETPRRHLSLGERSPEGEELVQLRVSKPTQMVMVSPPT